MNFRQFFYENINSTIPKSVWDEALKVNEELRVGVELMKKINVIFPKGEIYIVGGVPRDLLMGDEVADVDLATNIPFEELSKHFELRDISKAGSQPVNKINYKEFSFDLAQFRVDSKTYGRSNNVSTITNSFKEDSARRDISINSFGLTSDGEIIDYQGGIEDINRKVIKAVGDAKERFLEDASRILRIVRFAAKLGFEIEANTKQAIVDMKDTINDRSVISNEAISKEFYKAAKSGKTLRKFLDGLTDVGILQQIMPEFHAMDGLMHNPEHHPEGESKVLGHIKECLNASKFNDPVINLGVLFHDFGKATTYELKDGYKHAYHGHEAAGVPIVQNIFKRMVFPDLTAEDKEHILFAVANHMLVHGIDKLNTKSVTKLVNNSGWNVLKSVSYCDEASRGSGMFNPQDFDKKIKDAEDKVAVLGNAEELRKKIKQYIDGVKLMNWFPFLTKKQSLIGQILPEMQDYILAKLGQNEQIDEQDLFKKAASILTAKGIQNFY
jgi:tRNA nucleotidyltransferase/poly(A) polymerase